MTFVVDDAASSGLERKSPTETADIAEIVRGMLAIQAQAAAAGKRWKGVDAAKHVSAFRSG